MRADVTALGGDDAVEEGELGVNRGSIKRNRRSGFDGAFPGRHVRRVSAAGVGSDVDAPGHVAIDFEVRVQSPLDQTTGGSKA